MLREIIVFTPIYISLFWSIVFISNKFSDNKARFWLGIFMVVVAILYGCHAAYFLDNKNLYLKLDSIYLLSGLSVYPLYYIYIRLLTCDLKLKSSYIFHFLPAIVLFLILYVTSQFSNPPERKIYFETVLVNYEWPWQDASPNLRLMSSAFFISRIIFGFQALVYLLLGYRLAKKYNDRIANFYSNLEGRELVWVKLLTISFLITSVLSTAVNVLGRGLFFENDFLLAMPSFLFSSLFFIIGLQGNKQNFTIRTLNEDEKEDCGPAKSLTELRNEKLKSDLLVHLKDEESYLDPELTITGLCRVLNTNRTYLSNLINNEFKISFNDLINQYRVEHAISIIRNDAGNSLSPSDIAVASGFGSLSSFNRAFKKNKGTTVGQFKKKLPQENYKLTS